MKPGLWSNDQYLHWPLDSKLSGSLASQAGVKNLQEMAGNESNDTI